MVLSLKDMVPASVLADDMILRNVYFSGFQFGYVKGTDYLLIYTVTLRPQTVIDLMVVILEKKLLKT